MLMGTGKSHLSLPVGREMAPLVEGKLTSQVPEECWLMSDARI